MNNETTTISYELWYSAGSHIIQAITRGGDRREIGRYPSKKEAMRGVKLLRRAWSKESSK